VATEWSDFQGHLKIRGELLNKLMKTRNRSIPAMLFAAVVIAAFTGKAIY
jgi:hypothetical protein